MNLRGGTAPQGATVPVGRPPVSMKSSSFLPAAMRRRRSTQRFTGRSSSYSEGRPGYPRGVLDFLRRCAGLRKDDVIADVGSGTGKLSQLLLANGNEVFCVEPNADMREEAERLLSGARGFHSVAGTAERTGLGDRSVDLVTVAQALHWFRPLEARREFSRILKPPGYVLLVWNTRRSARGTFGHDYDNLVKEHTGRAHGWSSSRAQERKTERFLGGRKVLTAELRNSQALDFEHLLARIRSSSYMPNGGRGWERVERDARSVFDRHARRGKVSLEYVTELRLCSILR